MSLSASLSALASPFLPSLSPASFCLRLIACNSIASPLPVGLQQQQQQQKQLQHEARAAGEAIAAGGGGAAAAASERDS